MIKHLDKQFPLLTFVFLSWVTMWVSINAIPYEIEYMTDSFINFRGADVILIWLISILFIGGLIAWASESYDKNYPRLIALITVVLDFVLMFMLLQKLQ